MSVDNHNEVKIFMAACVNENHFDKFLELSEALVLIYKVPFCKVNNLFSAASLDTMC